VVLCLALAVAYFHWNLFSIMIIVWGLFIPATVLPVLGGLLTRRLSANGAMAGYLGGMIVGIGLLVCNGVMKPANPIEFEAVTIIVSFGFTAAVLAVAAIWFPATGEAAERAATFFAALRRPSVATSASVVSPTPIAGRVIGIMGLALVIVGLGLFANTTFNVITLGMGCLFGTIGLGMVLPDWFKRRRELNVEATGAASTGGKIG
jgi:hypothetical protein